MMIDDGCAVWMLPRLAETGLQPTIVNIGYRGLGAAWRFGLRASKFDLDLCED